MRKTIFKITDITHYEDVCEGRLVMCVGEKEKSWRVVWMAYLRLNSLGEKGIPAGAYSLGVKANQRWVCGLQVKIHNRKRLWIEPLISDRWEDFGTDIYLCEDNDSLTPVGRMEYGQLVRALEHFGITELLMEKPQRYLDGNRLRHEDLSVDFWGNQLNEE